MQFGALLDHWQSIGWFDMKSALDDLFFRRLVFLLVAGVERQNVRISVPPDTPAMLC